MSMPNPASPPDRGLDAALVAVNAIRVLEARVHLLESENAALRAEQTPSGVLVQPVGRLAYTVAETAVALGIGRQRAYELVRSGALGAVQPEPGGDWIVPVAGIERWLQHHGQPAPLPMRAVRKGAAR